MELDALRRLHDRWGVGVALLLSAEYVLLRSRVATGATRALYSAVAPGLFRRWYPTDLGDGSASTDPFKLERVDPRRIDRFTPRLYPPWRGRRRLFGAVRAGDWDRRPLAEIPRRDGPPAELFLGETVEESPLYRAVERHFEDDVPWEETEFVREVLSRVEGGIGESEFVWQDCRSPADVRARCRRLDEIYRSLEREGCRSCRERTDPRGRERGFLDVAENEIVVDVGRDGELLLVSGQHRLFLSRVLGLSEVPIAFLVRHAGWMRTREAVARGDASAAATHRDHPDLRDLNVRTERSLGRRITP
jgi:hypothetical protein